MQPKPMVTTRSPVGLSDRASRSPVPAPFVGTVLGAILCIFVPLWVTESTPDPADSRWLGALFIAVVSGGAFSATVAARIRQPYLMIFWLFSYSFLGLAPLVQMRTEQDPATTPNIIHSLDLQVLMLVAVGLLAVIAGTLAFNNFRGIEIAAYGERTINQRRANLLTLLILAISWLYAGGVGISRYLSSRTELAVARSDFIANSTISTIVYGIASIGLIVVVLAQIQMWRRNRASGVRGSALLLWASLTTLVFTVNPISSSRYLFGTAALAVLVQFGLFSTMRRYRTVCAGAVAGLLLVFPALDVFRRDVEGQVAFENPVNSLAASDFDSFAQISNTVYYVSMNGFEFGKQAFSIPFFWIPRSIWPDKPEDTGILLANFRDYSFSNLSAPIWAEFFINFGWVGVAVGMFALGWFMRKADLRSEATFHSYGTPSIVTSILPFYGLIILRGSLLQATFNVVLIFVLAMMIEQKREAIEKDISTV